MKRILMIVGLVALAACSSYAGTSVEWRFFWGVYQHGQVDLSAGDTGTGIAASQDVLWQLVFTGTDNTPDAVNPFNSGSGYVGDDDQVVFTRVTPAGGGATVTTGSGLNSADGLFTEWLNAPGTVISESATTFSGGSFYIRAFQDATPAVGEWYYDSPTTVAQNIALTDPLRTAQLVEGNPNFGTSGDAPNVQIVPEPSTVALILVGLGMVGYRRLRSA